MRVNTLVVVVFVTGFDTDIRYEERDVAASLYDKHMGRKEGEHRPMRAILFEVRNDKPTGEADALTLGTNVKVTKSTGLAFGNDIDSADTGVYLVFHAQQSSTPQIFGVGNVISADTKASNAVQAARLVKTLQSLGIKGMRKLSLVACNVTNNKTAGSKNFLVAVGKALIDGYPSNKRPIIAGYDDYVTTKANGSKVVGSGSAAKPAKETGAKQVWVYKAAKLFGEGDYGKVALVESGWSDKQQLATNTGVTAITS